MYGRRGWDETDDEEYESFVLGTLAGLRGHRADPDEHRLKDARGMHNLIERGYDAESAGGAFGYKSDPAKAEWLASLQWPED